MTAFAPDCLAFDLDGTLVDTIPDIASSVDHMLVTLGRQPASQELVRIWIGNGMDILLARAIQHTDGREPDAATLAAGREAFKAHYGANFCVDSQLYPDTIACLETLASRGLPMAVVTNKPIQFTLPLLDQLEIRRFFPVVLGGDSLPVRKPDPEPLHEAVRQLHPTAKAPMMIGDSRNDIQAARNAGWPVIALTYGYNHGEDIRLAKPDAVIDSLAQLPPLLI